MIKLGDIVTPEDCCCGHGYLFRVSSLVRTMGYESRYKLQRFEQALDLRKGSSKEQLAIIKRVEDSIWGENELQVLEPTIETAVKMENKNLYDICVQGNYEGITIRGDSSQNKKEEKEMDILDLYKERKIKALERVLLEAKEKVKKEDKIQNIILEMTNQVNTILENQGLKKIYEFQPSLVTLETELKIDELNDKYNEEVESLRSTLDEIRALFELTDDYNERIKILKDYDILDKKGKLNV